MLGPSVFICQAFDSDGVHRCLHVVCDPCCAREVAIMHQPRLHCSCAHYEQDGQTPINPDVSQSSSSGQLAAQQPKAQAQPTDVLPVIPDKLVTGLVDLQATRASFPI